jgi:hypothetical protein
VRKNCRDDLPLFPCKRKSIQSYYFVNDYGVVLGSFECDVVLRSYALHWGGLASRFRVSRLNDANPQGYCVLSPKPAILFCIFSGKRALSNVKSVVTSCQIKYLNITEHIFELLYQCRGIGIISVIFH